MYVIHVGSHVRQFGYHGSRLVTGLVLACLLTACSHWHPTLAVDREIPFTTFLASVKAAQLSDFTKAPGTRVESPAAFEEMKTHIMSLYDSVTPLHTFLGRDNQFVDCIPIEQQPALRHSTSGAFNAPSEAPTPSQLSPAKDEQSRATRPPADRRAADITLKPGVQDRFQKEMFCAAGTIPMRRVTLDEMTRFRTLQDFFAKGGRLGQSHSDTKVQSGELVPGDPSHYYAAAFQTVDNVGGDSWLNLWNPRVSTHQMSLSQIWVSAGEGDSIQTVEAGWQVMPDKWSTTQAALFIYYTTQHYKKGTGCYNLDCAGFVQLANTVYLGAPFDHYSEREGGQWGFNLQVKHHTDGNWWLFYRGPSGYIAVGYYPGTLYGTGGMAREATSIGWGGEDTGDPTACQMGSGALSSEGWGRAAYQDNVFYIDTQTVSQWTTLYRVEQPADCYTTDIHNAVDTGQKTYFYFGGPKCK